MEYSDHLPKILYRDRHCLVAYKPPRMLTVGDHSGDPHLLDWVKAHEAARQKPGTKGFVAPVHFLDRPVSGAVLFALSTKGASRLGAQFRERSIRKIYLVVVETKNPVPFALGNLYTLEDFLKKDPITNRVKVVPKPSLPRPQTSSAQTSRTPKPQKPRPDRSDNQAQLCNLRFRILTERNNLKLLEVELGTGRSHQIRVQLANQGLPVMGDLKYGASQPFKAHKHSLIALHAYRLSFLQPVGGETIHIYAPPPTIWYETFGTGLLDRLSDHMETPQHV